jgi:hypothetical protein
MKVPWMDMKDCDELEANLTLLGRRRVSTQLFQRAFASSLDLDITYRAEKKMEIRGRDV